MPICWLLVWMSKAAQRESECKIASSRHATSEESETQRFGEEKLVLRVSESAQSQ